MVSIPLEQGNVFRPQMKYFKQQPTSVSIPLEQGNVFRPERSIRIRYNGCLNPFGTGQCLSTRLEDLKN